MVRFIRYIILIALLQAVAGIFLSHAQSFTSASGIVKDSITGEPLPFVSVYFDGSTIGAMTDDNGTFTLQNNQGYTKLAAASLGYDTKFIDLKPGKKNDNLEVLLKPTAFEISEVVVKPKREKYTRKDNPAVELIKKVIAHKNDNRIEAKPEYQTEVYEKLSLSLDNFNPNLDKNKFLKKFKFIKNYLDTSEFNGKPILTVSVRENLSDFYYRKSPKAEKTIVRAKRMQGIDKTLDDGGGITSNLEEIFKSINIFDNNIPILLNRFVSPLSSTLATTYYHYYIMDTLDVGGDKCVDLAFVPANSESYGFTGRLYITLDGNYAVKKVLLNTPANINLNWVDKLRIEQEFKQMPDSTWVLDQENTFVNFYVVKGTQQLYAHQLRNYDNYNFNVQNADSVFGLLGALHVLPEATAQPDTFWTHNRPIPLKEKEDALKDLLGQLRKVPAFNAIIKTAEILITGYIPTANDKKVTKFDFGPMNTTFSANHLEGFRMRVGGMTTANLNPYWFASGYLAYGTNDRKIKYNLKLTHSFTKKEYHEGENPVNNLSFIQEYDVYTPGQDFLFTSKDNIFVAWKVGEPVTKMQYIRKSVLKELVLADLQRVTSYVKEHEQEFIETANECSAKAVQKTLTQQRKELDKAQSRISELNILFRKLYEDNALGKLSDEQFAFLTSGYDEEKKTLTRRIAELSQEIDNATERSADVKRFVALVRKYTAITELTYENVHEFIDRILIHELDKETNTRKIEIFYSFVGRVDTGDKPTESISYFRQIGADVKSYAI